LIKILHYQSVRDFVYADGTDALVTAALVVMALQNVSKALN